MATALETLCERLDQELIRQRDIVAALRGAPPASSPSVPTDEDDELSRMRRLGQVVHEALLAEADRHEAVRSAAAELSLPPDACTLTVLITCAGEPWRGRLAETQTQLLATLEEAGMILTAQKRIVRRSLAECESAVGKLFGPDSASAAGYCREGRRSVPGAASQARMMDQRG